MNGLAVNGKLNEKSADEKGSSVSRRKRMLVVVKDEEGRKE